MDRMLRTTLALALLCAALPAQAAQKSVTVEARTRIIDGGREWHESRPYDFTFEVEVVSDREGPKPESRRWGRPFVTAFPGEEYRVRVHNPLPVPVAANLTIDGLNSITGDPGSPSGGSKWIIEPFSWVEITGWQVSRREARRFVFTSREGSYASWRSNAWGRDLAVNCGVIGVAYFWPQGALDEYYHDNPVVIRRPTWSPGWPGGVPEAGMSDSMARQGAPAGEMQQRAGTGMGQRQSNPVREVSFSYDRGMYEVREAVIIYYDFPEEGRPPRAFDDDGFAPEPPRGGWRPPYFPPPRRPDWPPGR
ncbi:MAG TPA: hypothetical protein VN317_04490 [Candidatus Methanoperedens sp.]|nr:hypothetical protein [Candidatus Methanoperedens sp.]